MNLFDRVIQMGNDLGMSKSDLLEKLNCSRATFYRFKNNPEVQNFNEVFSYFKDKYDLNYIRFGNVVNVKVSLNKGEKINESKLTDLIKESVEFA